MAIWVASGVDVDVHLVATDGTALAAAAPALLHGLLVELQRGVVDQHRLDRRGPLAVPSAAVPSAAALAALVPAATLALATLATLALLAALAALRPAGHPHRHRHRGDGVAGGSWSRCPRLQQRRPCRARRCRWPAWPWAGPAWCRRSWACGGRRDRLQRVGQLRRPPWVAWMPPGPPAAWACPRPGGLGCPRRCRRGSIRCPTWDVPLVTHAPGRAGTARRARSARGGRRHS